MADRIDKDETKLSRVVRALADGDVRTALRIAAAFPQLGKHKERITRGWAALQSPVFYRELGHDPDLLVADAVAAIKERYKLG